jgi:hypothetical protein
MKLLFLALAGLMAAFATACGGANTEVYVGTLVSGTVTASDPDTEGGKSQSYVIRVREGVEHYVFLNGPDGNIAGIWSAGADDFILQANPEAESRTATHTFSESGFQEIFVMSLDSDIPSPFTFKIWVP